MSTTVTPGFFDFRQQINNKGNYVFADVPYLVLDAATADAAALAVLANTPEWSNGMQRQHADLDEQITATNWRFKVRYQMATGGQTTSDGEEPATIRSFQVGGGQTEHVTQALGTRHRYGDAPDLHGAIGYDGTTVHGVDILKPSLTFTVVRTLPRDIVTTAFIIRLYHKQRHYNADSWNGFAPGEVLFLGADTTDRGDTDEDWVDVTYRFAAAPNVTDLQIGEFTVEEALGWDYTWFRYAAAIDDDTNELVQRPVGAYVQQLYASTSFASLGVSL